MKKIGITQRVDEISSYKERRDSLDQNWADLFCQLEMLPLPLANINTCFVEALLSELRLDGILFSGGNSLAYLESDNPNNTPERDRFELALLECAIKNQIPVVGVCRGMQLINHYFGGGFQKVEGHIATEHELLRVNKSFEFPEKVNSYHGWGIPSDNLGAELIPLATDAHGNIEAFRHKEHKVYGIMWHPERDLASDQKNTQLLKRFYS